MLFNSLEFLLLFLPLTFLALRRQRGNRLLFLISLASFIFYGFAGHWWFLIPMAVTTGLDFLLAIQMGQSTSRGVRRALLTLSLACNLGLLAYFKYSSLALHLLGHLGAGSFTTSWLPTILPAGISFYTFQTISYVVDVYRGELPAERNFLKFVSFVTFFPHLVAGPLTRHNQLLPQLTNIARDGIKTRWTPFLFLFSLGMIKKVLIADRLGQFIDPLVTHLGSGGLVGAWLAAIGYSLQIYFDFSGYSEMALGLGFLFGISLPQNFNSPYQATSPSDFWRRWHMTLSQWLRDYLYISLGGNRGSRWRVSLNLMLTMILGGLWHGAAAKFLVWGAFHGTLLVSYKAIEQNWKRQPLGLQQAETYFLVCLGWTIFRADSLGGAFVWLSALAGLQGIGDTSVLWQPVTFLLFAAWALAYFGKNNFQRGWETVSGKYAAGLAALTGLAVLMMNYGSSFLYYQF